MCMCQYQPCPAPVSPSGKICLWKLGHVASPSLWTTKCCVEGSEFCVSIHAILWANSLSLSGNSNIVANFVCTPGLVCLCFSETTITHFWEENLKSDTFNEWNACPLWPVKSESNITVLNISCFKVKSCVSGQLVIWSRTTLASQVSWYLGNAGHLLKTPLITLHTSGWLQK